MALRSLGLPFFILESDLNTGEMLDAFNPFSLGKQNCMGQSLAKAETLAIVPKICSQFDLTVEDEGDAAYFLTLKPVGARLSARRL